MEDDQYTFSTNSFEDNVHPPSFPRPSSSVSKMRLGNRISFGPHKKFKNANRNIEDFEQSEDIAIKGSSLWIENDNSVYYATEPIFQSQELNFSTSKSKINERSSSNLSNHSRIKSKVSLLNHQSNHLMSEILKANDLESFIENLINKNTEFVYLKQLPNNPYKFSLAEKVPLNQSSESTYVTLSCHGITRHSSYQESEILTFEDFIFEQKIYYKLQSIPLFYNFRRWKCFYVWKELVRSQLRAVRTKSLTSKLLFLDPAIYELFVRCGEICTSLRKLEILSIEKHTIYDIEDFKSLQIGLQKKASQVKENLIQNLVKYLSKEAEIRVLASVNINVSQSSVISSSNYQLNDQIISEDSIYSSSSATLNAFNLTSSQYKPTESTIHEKSYLTYSDKSVVRQICRKIYSLLRLTDFRLRESLYECVENNLINFRSSLHRIRSENDNMNPDTPLTERTYGVFRLTAHLFTSEDSSTSSSAITLHPSSDTITKTFKHILGGVYSFRSYSLTLCSHEALQEIFIPILNEISSNLSTEDVIPTNSDDQISKNSRSSIYQIGEECYQIFESCLNRCLDLVSSHSFLCTNYDNNLKLYHELNLSKVSQLKSEEFSIYLDGFKRQHETLKLLPNSYEIGVIRFENGFNLKKFTANLSECTENAQKNIISHFVNISEKIFLELSNIKQSMSTTPQSVDEFVMLIEKYQIALANQKRLTDSIDYIADIKGVLEYYDIPFPESILIRYLSLQSIWYQLIDALDKFADLFEENVKFYYKEIESRWKSLQILIQNVNTLLKSETLFDITADPLTNIQIFDDIGSRMEIIRKRYAELDSLEKSMKVHVLTPEILINLEKEISSNYLIWQTVYIVRELKDHILSSPFKDLNCTEIIIKLETYQDKLTFKVQRGNSSVTPWLRETIIELQELIPLVQMLQSNTFRDRHFLKLTECLKQNIYQDSINLTQICFFLQMESMKISKNSPPTKNFSSSVENECNLNRSNKLNTSSIKSSFLRRSSIVDHTFAVSDLSLLTIHYDEIFQIHESSIIEYNIEQSKNDIENSLKELDFKLELEQESKSTYVFTNMNDILITLDDFFIGLTTIKSSCFSHFHIDTIDRLITKIHSIKDTIENILKFQTYFLKFRIFYLNPRVVRFIPNASKLFAALEDFWRVVVKITKENPKITNITSLSYLTAIVSRLKDMISAAEKAHQAVISYIDDQRRKYPRLYLIPKETLIEIFATADVPKIFSKCCLLLNLTGLIYDRTDENLTIGAISHHESMIFKSPSSSRSSLVDWLRGIFQGVNERLRHDIKQLAESTSNAFEDIKTSKSIDQARITAIQTKFWDNFNREPDHISQHLIEINQIIQNALFLFQEYRSNYQRKALFNILVVYSSFRDLLSTLENPMKQGAFNEGGNSFMIDCAIKKTWDKKTSSVQCQLSDMVVDYGMVYSGFEERLVITPFTDKCYVAIWNAMRNNVIPILKGLPGCNKSSVASELAVLLGADYTVCNCDTVSCMEDLLGAVQAGIGCGMMIIFNNVEKLIWRNSLLASLLGCLLSIRRSIEGKTEKVTLGGIHLLPASKSIKVTLIYNTASIGNAFPDSLLPVSVQNYFRPLEFTFPQRTTVISLIMNSFGFGFPETTTLLGNRLNAFGDYLISSGHLSVKQTNHYLIKAVRSTGEYFLLSTSKASLNLGLHILKEFIQSLPIIFRSKFSRRELSLILSLYFDTILQDNNNNNNNDDGDDNDEIYSSIVEANDSIHPSSAYEKMKTILMGNEFSSLIVQGPRFSGKTRLVKKVIHDLNTEITLGKYKEGKGQESHSNSNTHSNRNNINVMNTRSDHYKFELFDHPINYKFIMNANSSEDFQNYLNFFEKIEKLCFAKIHPKKELVLTLGNFPADLFILFREFSNEYMMKNRVSIFLISENSNPDAVMLHPGIFQHTALISFNNFQYNTQEYIDCKVDIYFEMFLIHQKLHFKELVESMVLPCLTAIMELEDPAVFYHQLNNALNLIRLLYYNAGLDATTTISQPNPSNPSNPPNPPILGVIRDEKTLKSIVIYSMIWSIGAVSYTSRQRFINWFQTEYENAVAADASIFPPLHDPFSYYLSKDYNNPNGIVWRKWNANYSIREGQLEEMNLNPFLDPQFNHVYYHPGISSFPSNYEMLVPTPIGSAVLFIQNFLLKNKGTMIIYGENGVGKSSLLQQMGTNSLLSHRCICKLYGESTSELQNHIYAALSKNILRMKERNLNKSIAIFIDDVHIPTQLENLNYFMENQVCYENNNHRFVEWFNTFAAIGVSGGPSFNKAEHRALLNQSYVIELESSDSVPIFSSVLFHACPNFPPDISYDLMQLTHLTFEKFKSFHLSLETTTVTTVDRDKWLLTYTGSNYGTFSTYIINMLKIISQGVQIITRNDAIRFYSIIIKDFISELPHEIQFIDHLTNAFTKQSFKFLTSGEILSKEFHRDSNSAVSSQQTGDNNRAFIKESGYWFSGTSRESIKAHFIINHHADYLSTHLNQNHNLFWKDVHKFSSLILLSRVYSIIHYHSGVKTINSVIHTASVLSRFSWNFYEINSKNIESIIRDLTYKIVNLLKVHIDENQSSSFDFQHQVWHFHVTEFSNSITTLLKPLISILNLQSELVVQNFNETASGQFSSIPNNFLTAFTSVQIPILSFSNLLEMSKAKESVESISRVMNGRLYRPIQLSPKYTFEAVGLDCELLVSAVGARYTTLLESLFNANISLMRQTGVDENILSHILHPCYRNGTIKSFVRLLDCFKDSMTNYDDGVDHKMKTKKRFNMCAASVMLYRHAPVYFHGDNAKSEWFAYMLEHLCGKNRRSSTIGSFEGNYEEFQNSTAITLSEIQDWIVERLSNFTLFDSTICESLCKLLKLVPFESSIGSLLTSISLSILLQQTLILKDDTGIVEMFLTNFISLESSRYLIPKIGNCIKLHCASRELKEDIVEIDPEISFICTMGAEALPAEIFLVLFLTSNLPENLDSLTSKLSIFLPEKTFDPSSDLVTSTARTSFNAILTEKSTLGLSDAISDLLFAISRTMNKNSQIVQEIWQDVIISNSLEIERSRRFSFRAVNNALDEMFINIFEYINNRISVEEADSIKIISILTSQNGSHRYFKLPRMINALKLAQQSSRQVLTSTNPNDNEWRIFIESIQAILQNISSASGLIETLQTNKEKFLSWLGDVECSRLLKLPPIDVSKFQWNQLFCLLTITKPHLAYKLLDLCQLNYAKIKIESFPGYIPTRYTLAPESTALHLGRQKTPFKHLLNDLGSMKITTNPTELQIAPLDLTSTQNSSSSPTLSSSFRKRSFSSPDTIKKKELQHILIYRGNQSNESYLFSSEYSNFFHSALSPAVYFLSDVMGPSSAMENANKDIEADTVHVILNDFNLDLVQNNWIDALLRLQSNLSSRTIILETREYLSTLPLVKSFKETEIGYIYRDISRDPKIYFCEAARYLATLCLKCSRNVKMMFSRLLWLLCIYYSEISLRISSDLSTLSFGLLESAAKYIKHLLFSSDQNYTQNIHTLLSYLKEIIYGFAGYYSEMNIQKIKNIFTVIFTSENCSLDFKLRICDDLMIPDIFNVENVDNFCELILKSTSFDILLTSTSISSQEINEIASSSIQKTLSKINGFVITKSIEYYIPLSLEKILEYYDGIQGALPNPIDIDEILSVLKSIGKKSALKSSNDALKKKRLSKKQIKSQSCNDDDDREINKRKLNPLFAFLLLEISSFNSDIELSSLKIDHYKKYVSNRISFDSGDDMIHRYIFDNKLPYDIFSCFPIDMIEWGQRIRKHKVNLENWVNACTIPGELSLNDFHTSQGLLQALAESYASLHKCKLSEVHITIEIVDDTSSRPGCLSSSLNPDKQQEIFLSNAVLRNAYWDLKNRRLVLDKHKNNSQSSSYIQALNIKISAQNNKVETPNTFNVPIYLYPSSPLILNKMHSNSPDKFIFNNEIDGSLFFQKFIAHIPLSIDGTITDYIDSNIFIAI